MRNKLQIFTNFANTLLPHETHYLLGVQQLADQVKLGILERVDYNCQHINQFTPYDPNIDKRKYSHLKNWVQQRLTELDVDAHFEWMSTLERQITTDAIEAEEEKTLLREIRQYQHPGFFFTKFYELVQQYRHFLLIRMRYADHETVHKFLETYQEAYANSKRISEQFHQATLDIVKQYSENSAESIQWEKWLTRIFYDETLEGYTRYMAFVRLTFISFNYRKLDLLGEKFAYLDRIFGEGKFYSKRILLNYYHLRMLLHARLREFDKAIHYGYLSIRGKTHDYLFYVNNLGAVLLRGNKPQEALTMMRNAAPEMKSSQNFYNKVGFVAFYIKCLLQNQLLRNAESYAETFLSAYEKEVLQYRWHTFFTAYMGALLSQRKFQKMIRVATKYRLLDLEKGYETRPDYVPALLWYTSIAQYKEEVIDKNTLQRRLQDYFNAHRGEKDRSHQIGELLNELKPHAPEVINYLQIWT